MHVRVDDAGQDEQPGGVNRFARGAFGERGDFPVGDADERMWMRVANEQVEVRHDARRAGG